MQTRNVLFAGSIIILLVFTYVLYRHNDKSTALYTPGFPATDRVNSGSSNFQPKNLDLSIKPISIGDSSMLPPSVVYKTRQDYSNLVWVQLSVDKSRITAYPAPTDIIRQTPVALHNGYYTGSVGINTAFINITIAEYSKLTQTISPDQLYDLIIDRDPVIELYNCGSHTSITDINTIVVSNQLSIKCNQLL